MSFPEASVPLRWCFVVISLVDFITVSEIVRVWFHLWDPMVVCWTISMTKILSLLQGVSVWQNNPISWCPAWWFLYGSVTSGSSASRPPVLAPDVDYVLDQLRVDRVDLGPRIEVLSWPPGFVFILTAMRVLGHLTFVISRKQIVRFILLIEWWYKNEKNANFVVSWLKKLSYKYCVYGFPWYIRS